jgi:FkbM family methyltransferase
VNWISKVLSILPGTTIEQLYNSRFGKSLVSLYDFASRNVPIGIYKVQNLALMELDTSKPGERALPFGAFEPDITKRFLSYVKEGDIVFDVGSWIGYYALLAAPKAKQVIAIEADPVNCERIKKNIYLNSFHNIELLNVAIGEGESRGSIIKGPGSLMHRVDRGGTENTIPIRNLDSIILDLHITNIDILIMDIEGFEYYAIKGLSKALSSGIVKRILCEVHPNMLNQEGISHEEVITLLTNYGYSIQIMDKSPRGEPYHISAAQSG